jgi:hypothetical protein
VGRTLLRECTLGYRKWRVGLEITRTSVERREVKAEEDSAMRKDLVASGPISRILSSRLRVIAALKLRRRAQPRRRSFLWAADRSTAQCSLPEGFVRTPRSAPTSNGPGRPSPPIWPCAARGLPCRGHYCPRGRLLPYHFTLAMCRALKRSAQGLASG